MAKRTSRTVTNYSIVQFTAFWGIIISGIVSLVTFIIRALVKWNVIKGAGSAVNTALSVMTLIANLALFVSAFLAAYGYSFTKSKTWRILFWVFAVLAFLSILGFNILGMFL